jgi:hypothetical protein
MARIYLICWKATESQEKARILQIAGHKVIFEMLSPVILRKIKLEPPDLFIIDLSRLPSQGRDVALNLRRGKKSRYVPIIFIDGLPEKVAIVKNHLPDAIYTTWEKILAVIKEAISNPLKNPVVPRSALEGYADAPLIKKLGIKTNYRVALIGAPREFKRQLDGLPDGVKFGNRINDNGDLVIWFVKTLKDYQSRIEDISAKLGEDSGLWVAWPKKSSRVSSGLTQNIVRQIGLATGLVDYKVCSIDETWSGLKFRKRKSKK